jgi:hypothetical protein
VPSLVADKRKLVSYAVNGVTHRDTVPFSATMLVSSMMFSFWQLTARVQSTAKSVMVVIVLRIILYFIDLLIYQG